MFDIIKNVLRVASLVLVGIAVWKTAKGRRSTGYVFLGMAFFSLSLIN